MEVETSVRVLSVQKNPAGFSIPLVKPTVKLCGVLSGGQRSRNSTTNMDISETSNDQLYGKIVKFKSPKFHRFVPAEKKILISVYDIDQHGFPCLVAESQCSYEDFNFGTSSGIGWHALTSPRGEGDVFVQVQGEKGRRSKHTEGYPETKGSDVYQDSFPADCLKLHIVAIEHLYNEGKKADETACYVKVTYGDKDKLRPPIETRSEAEIKENTTSYQKDLHPHISWSFYFKLEPGEPLQDIQVDVVALRGAHVQSAFKNENETIASYTVHSSELFQGSSSGIKGPEILRTGHKRTLQCEMEVTAKPKIAIGHKIPAVGGFLTICVEGIRLQESGSEMAKQKFKDTPKEPKERRRFWQMGEYDPDFEEFDDDEFAAEEELAEGNQIQIPTTSPSKGWSWSSLLVQQSLPEDEQKTYDEEPQERLYPERTAAVHLPEGDYSVTVNIIEIHGLTTGKTHPPDPFVEVTVCGQRKVTEIKQDCNSAYFDQNLIFPLTSYKSKSLLHETLRVEVIDASSFFGKKLVIGSWKTDFQFVYLQPDLEFYREQVPLMGAGGITGWVLLSITITAPGEKPKEHNRIEEIAEEQRKKTQHGGIHACLLDRRVYYLIASIEKAELVDLEKTKITPFVEIRFGGSKLRTKALYHQDQPRFKQQLWIPFFYPCTSSDVGIHLFRQGHHLGHEDEKPKYVGSAVPIKIHEVMEYATYFKTSFWVNLYGDQSDTVAGEQLNTLTDNAIQYKGRVLLSLQHQKESKQEQIKATNLQPFRVRLKKRLSTPPSKTYLFKAQIFIVAEIQDREKYSVQFSVGEKNYIKYPDDGQSYDSGTLYFYGQEPTWDKLDGFPEDLTQFPDIFIFLLRGKTVISYYRVPANQLYNEDEENPNKYSSPTWLELVKEPNQSPYKDDSDKHPGMVLVKMKLEDFDSKKHASSEKKVFTPGQTLKSEPFKARVFIFQARDLPATDPNGLSDPWVKVCFGGKTCKTEIIEKTKNPHFYECLEMEVQLLPETQKMPIMIFQVYDRDEFLRDEYIGAIHLEITEEMMHNKFDYWGAKDAESNWFDAAKWIPIGRELRGDIQGELLVAVELISLADLRNEKVLKPKKEDLRPPTRKMSIEILALGCRNLTTINPTGLQAPFVRLKIDGASFMRETDKSSSPSPYDPNFKTNYFLEDIQLPLNLNFAPALSIEVYDPTLLGEALVGSTYVPLDDRMKKLLEPNSFDRSCEQNASSINPYLDFEAVMAKRHRSKENDLAESNTKAARESYKKATKRTSLRFSRLSAADNQEGIELKELDGNTTDERESTVVAGQNMFGPAFDIDEEAEKQIVQAEKWLKDREKLGKEWEEAFASRVPFEHFVLYTGFVQLSKTGAKSTRKRVGVFKGLVRILSQRVGTLDTYMKEITENAAEVICRLYVLSGNCLMSKDEHNNSSDPYVKVKLGSTVLGNRDEFLSQTLKPEFYKSFELSTKLPGPSQLSLEVYDKDLLSDDLIGTSTIDLEDRWFSKYWKEFGTSNEGVMKPIETRTLWSPNFTVAQGNLDIWLDIFDKPGAKANPLVEITPPPTLDYEVRMIVWRTQNIPNGDPDTKSSDLFIVCQLGIEEQNAKKTDTHFRAENGRGSFNWRMKFNLKLPNHKDGASRLKVEAWDYDLTGNELLCEYSLDLSIPMKKACYFLDKHSEGFQVFQPRPKEGGAERRDERRASILKVEEKAKLYSRPRGNAELAPLLKQSSRAEMVDLEQGKQEKTRKKEKPTTLWKTLKDQVGVGRPDNSYWLQLDCNNKIYKDQMEKDNKKPEVLISIEILTKELAESRQCGEGQHDPNKYPTLPPPEGRMDLTKMFNPLNMCSIFLQAFSSKVACACCILFFFAICIFLGPTLLSFLTLWLELPHWFKVVLALIVIGCVCTGMHVILQDFSKHCGFEHPAIKCWKKVSKALKLEKENKEK